jgi:hypothetical protein
VSASVSIIPISELADPCLEHLIGMEASIFAPHASASVAISAFGATLREMHDPSREIDLSLTVATQP